MRSQVNFYRSVGSMLFELARTEDDQNTQTARNNITAARNTLSAATKAYKTAKSDVGSKTRGSASRKRAARYLRDALNARRKVRTNLKTALRRKTEET